MGKQRWQRQQLTELMRRRWGQQGPHPSLEIIWNHMSLVHQPPLPPPTTGTQWHQVMSTLNCWSFIIKTQSRLLESRTVELKTWLGKNNTIWRRGNSWDWTMESRPRGSQGDLEAAARLFCLFCHWSLHVWAVRGSVKGSPSLLEISPKQQSWFEATLKIDVIHDLY